MKQIAVNNGRGLKILNRMQVRDTIRRYGPVSRGEVSRLTGLAPPTVTVFVNELLQAGVVKEVGHGESRGGRRPIMLELNPRAGFLLAMRIQRGEAVVALLDLAAHVLESRRLSLSSNNPEEVVETVGACCDSLFRSVKIKREAVLWCGVAISGIIDAGLGLVELSTNLAWEKVPFSRMLSARLGGIPVQVEKNSNAAAVAEKVFGNGQGCANLIYLNLSVGIGVGIILANEVFYGASGYAGEIGHLPLMLDGGPRCTCGRTGCFEALCGARAVLERVKAEIPEQALAKFGFNKSRLSIDEVTSPLLVQLPEMRRILEEVGRQIGHAVATLISLFNTERVILGGELARAGDVLVQAVLEVVKSRIFPEIARPVQVVRSTMPEDPPLMGAYALALDSLFAAGEWTRRPQASRRKDGKSIPDAGEVRAGIS